MLGRVELLSIGLRRRYAKKATIVFCGLVGVLAQNGYVDINWDRAEHDVMGGTKTYKKITLHKESVLHRLPKDVKVISTTPTHPHFERIGRAYSSNAVSRGEHRITR